MTTIPKDVFVRVAHGPATTSPDRQLLSAEELRRYDSFRSAQRRGCFAMGRATLRTLLAERLQTDPREVTLGSAPDGALEVGETGMFASLGHTVIDPAETTIVTIAAVASRPIGVDVEAFKLRRADLYERILDPSEYHLLEELGESHQRAQIVLWAIKEAVLKTNRSGLRVAMRRVGIEIDRDRKTALCHLPGGEMMEARYDLSAEYATAVAFRP